MGRLFKIIGILIYHTFNINTTKDRKIQINDNNFVEFVIEKFVLT